MPWGKLHTERSYRNVAKEVCMKALKKGRVRTWICGVIAQTFIGNLATMPAAVAIIGCFHLSGWQAGGTMWAIDNFPIYGWGMARIVWAGGWREP